VKTQEILTEARGPVGWIRLNRPHLLNALNAELVVKLDAALAKFEGDHGIRAVVITGVGRAFCAGGDLGSFTYSTTAEMSAMTAFLDRAAACIERIAYFPKPVMAAINGVTAAGGLEIALACDIAIASSDAQIGDGHSNYGLLPGAGGAARLARVVGPVRAKYLAFTGDLHPAEDFVAWGVIAEVVDASKLEDRVQELGIRIAQKSPLVLGSVKRLIDDSLDQSLETALRAERNAMYALWDTQDLREGLNAFHEKRAPVYRGR
jgi:enoyl-CoA hydratase